MIDKKKITFEDIIHQDKTMGELITLAQKIAETDTVVLITGESGTGKELFSKAIHYASSRGEKELITLNCAAVPDTLLESELFGHEKGSFTGAHATRKGKFELAHGGTLFLDEIGDMSLSAQAKILRAIEERKVERVGGSTPIPVDIRIITSTNRNLLDHVKKGLFRSDLYYRLNEVHLHLPPLRKRKADIPLLVKEFIQDFNKQYSKKIAGISDATAEFLNRHDWPGNVRELLHVVKCAALLVEGDTIWMEHIPMDSQVRIAQLSESGESDSSSTRASELLELMSLEEVEKRHILRILEYTNWNKSQTAKILQVSRPTLDRKIERYDLRPISN